VGRKIFASATVFLLLVGCSPDDSASVARGKKTPRVEKSKGPAEKKKFRERQSTGPKKALLLNDGLGDAARLTRGAVADLKEMGYWDDLTERIFAVRVSSRQRSVPLDEHLADSLWTFYRDEATGELGDLCDVVMFTRAIKDDVARQGIYYSQGRLAYPAPSVRQFWTVLLAHEIAHCTNRGQKGEAYSTRWEAKILEGYGIDRVGSP
jgi:hypothetical protein